MKSALYVRHLFKLILNSGIPNKQGMTYCFEATVETPEKAQELLDQLGLAISLTVQE